MATPSRFLALLGDEPERVVVAPMVNQSELAFRVLCRRLSNAKLCYTPMMSAKLFATSHKYRETIFATCEEDRPLIAQFCGHDPEDMVKAAKLVESKVDGIDLNLGCPQGIARKGRYGSFLLCNEPDLAVDVLRALVRSVGVPVSAKIRLIPGEETATLAFCQRLQDIGVEMITIHGRFKEQNKHLVGSCDWQAIARVKRALTIPVLANGGISSREDLKRCLLETNVNAVMSCEAILENPALFALKAEDAAKATPWSVTREYLELAEQYPSNQPKAAKAHVFKFLFGALSQHEDFFAKLGSARNVVELRRAFEELAALHETDGACRDEFCASFQGLPWYNRHRPELAALPPLDPNEPPRKRRKIRIEREDDDE